MPDVGTVVLPVALFAPNWDKSIVVTSSWATDAVVGCSTDEHRQSNVDRPYRSIKTLTMLRGLGDIAGLLTEMRQQTGKRKYTPLVSDQTHTTGTASGTNIPCDTTNRRFFIGYKVLIVSYDADFRVSQQAVSTIAALSASAITLVGGEALPISFPEGSEVYPAFEADVDLEAEADIETDQVCQVSFQARERIGTTALPALVQAGTNPPGEPTYQNIPVLVIEHDWEKGTAGEIRRGQVMTLGLDTVAEIYGDHSFATGSAQFTMLDRASAFRLLKFIDSRAGGAFSFWLPNRTSDLKPVARTSGTVWTVAKSLPLQDLLDRRFLAFWESNTAVQLKRITGVTDGGAVWNVTVDSAVTIASIDLLYRLSFACLAKFDTDSVDEEWFTNGTMSCSLKTVAVKANTCGDGEDGDTECHDDYFDPGDPTTDEDPEDPWDILDCSPAGVAVPMFYDSTKAQNERREPIRGADLNMPEEILIRVKSGWVKDSTHSHLPALSEELMDLLVGDHFLNFRGTLAGVRSRNPYHIRIYEDGFGGDWGALIAPGLLVTKKYWDVVEPYMVGATPHSLTHRFVAEWTEDRENGLWGTLFYYVAFATEVNPSYVDGTAWAPSGNLAFTKDDPYVWGRYAFGGSGSIELKYAHPQALIIAHIATTLHAPNGYAWMPLDRLRFKPCYKLKNGAPWSEGTVADAKFNSVFGYDQKAAMTLGGWTESKMFKYLCGENGLGAGITALKPTKAGWDEEVGELTPQNGNDLAIDCCNPGQSEQKINACDGHPDEPFEEVGGTHACFLNSPHPNFLCFSLFSLPILTLTESCFHITAEFEEYNGAFCPGSNLSCTSNEVPTSFTPALYNYTYNQGGNQEARYIEYREYRDDPNYERQGWVHGDGDVADWSQSLGTWTFGGVTFTNNSVSGSGTPSAFGQYNPPDSPIDDGEISALSLNTTAVVGFAWRRQPDGSGYYCIFNRVAGSATIYRKVGVSLTTLATITSGLGGVTNTTMVLRFEGSTFKLTIAGLLRLEVDDCAYETGDCGLIVSGALSGAQFQEVEVTDLNWRKLSAVLSVGSNICNVTVDPELGSIFATCEQDLGDPGCPSAESCPCRVDTFGLVSDYVFGHDFTIDTAVAPPGYGNPNPDCFEVNFGCGDCPPPFIAMGVTFPLGCDRESSVSNNPFVEGMDFWIISEVVVP